MNKFEYICDINQKEILKAIKYHECYDSWGEVQYGNDKRAVEYNICIDNTTKETEYCSAFYKIELGKDGFWHHDDCSEYYSYNIDFNDKNWKENLKRAAKQAFKELWD